MRTVLVDFHSHILPEIDHGSDGMQTSIAQVKRARDAGITKILATPHFYPDSDNVEEFLQKRDYSYNILRDEMNKQNIDIEIILGAEVNLQADIFEIKDLEKLRIGNTRYLLIEGPQFISWTHWVYDSINAFRSMGIEPIFAHIDRYNPEYIHRLFIYNVICQVNVSFFKSSKIKKRVMGYYKGGFVHLIGSDIHMDGIQYDIFKKYSKKYPQFFEYFTSNAQTIFNNEWLI